MEFEGQEENGDDTGQPAGHDTLGNSSRPSMSSPSETDAPPYTAESKPRYKECLKNHAVGIGGHAVDGCGEFMAAGEEGTLDALMCAACNCHRNFHRKESSAVAAAETLFPRPHPHLLAYHPHPHLPFSSYYRAQTPTGYLHVAAPQRALALPSTSGGALSREDQVDMWNPSGGGLSKKRFRTKFSQEQKDKMLGLAERLGWKIQKQDESVVHQFCNDTGISRHVLKVWMHNNKHTLASCLRPPPTYDLHKYACTTCHYMTGVSSSLASSISRINNA